jgi:hypothetical protein
VDDFGAGWYLNFNTSFVSAPNNAEFASVITVKQDKTAEGVYLPTYSINPALSDNELGALVDARPGSIWIAGNEVDRGPDPGQIEVNQGDTFPDIYARAYHDVYHYIKSRDATAQVANSALVQVTPGRIQYLDIMWDTYLELFGTPMPVDVWNMHLYILPEVNRFYQPNSIASVALGTDPTLGKKESYDPDGNGPLEPKDTCGFEDVYCFAEHDDISVYAGQVYAMRTWMRDHDQRNKPLILSEFSILYPNISDPGGTCFLQDEYGNCFTDERVVNFLNSAFNFLETSSDPDLGYPLDGNRLVQQWLWFSVNHGNGVGFVSNLIDEEPFQLSEVGQAFQTFVGNQPTTINLFADAIRMPVVFTDLPDGEADAPLSISVRNNGAIAPVFSFDVTFYGDEALSQPIGTAVVQPPGSSHPGMTGCARREREIYTEVTWEGLTAGLHQYWVKIDSGGWIAESDEGDNIASGFVHVNPYQNFTPLIHNP